MDSVRNWIEINTKSLDHNVQLFRNWIAPSTKLMCVVKSNAYGHGFVDVARHLEQTGNVDMLGVDSISEGLRLRKEGVSMPIVILGYTLPNLYLAAHEARIALTVSHQSTLDMLLNMSLDEQARFRMHGPLKVHIKVDTGMHRLGFLPDEKEKVFDSLKKLAQNLDEVGETQKALPFINVEGMYTHFAAAKNPSFPDYTKKQIAQFEAWKAACAEAGFAPMFHASATAGAILFKEAEYDMVRIGIGTYGLWPSREVQAFAERRLPLQPVLSWKTRICEWKQVQKGEKISYDGTETLWRDSRIAVCPIGYWHGFPRALSSIGEVLVRGQRAKVLGRVAMDMIIIDCTDSGCDIGDEVVIIGRQGNEEVTLVEMAAKADASWYELVTRLNPLIKKIHVA